MEKIVLFIGVLCVFAMHPAPAQSAPTAPVTAQPIAISDPAPAATPEPGPTAKPFKVILPSIHMSDLEGAVIGFQVIDSFETGRCIHTGFCFETNRTVRPFSRGGALEMFGSFLAADILRNLLLRRAGRRAQNAALIVQGAMNIAGILETTRVTRIINAYKARYCNVYIKC